MRCTRCKVQGELYDLSVLGMAARPIGSLTGSKNGRCAKEKTNRDGYPVHLHYVRSVRSFPIRFNESVAKHIHIITIIKKLLYKCELQRALIKLKFNTNTTQDHSVQHSERIHVDSTSLPEEHCPSSIVLQ